MTYLSSASINLRVDSLISVIKFLKASPICLYISLNNFIAAYLTAGVACAAATFAKSIVSFKGIKGPNS